MNKARFALGLGVAGTILAAVVLVNWLSRHREGDLTPIVELQPPSNYVNSIQERPLEGGELAGPETRILEKSEAAPATPQLETPRSGGPPPTRLAKLQALHERLLQCPADSEMEWRVAYDIMTEAMLVEMDRQKAFAEGNGASFRTKQTEGQFETYNSGRQYSWSSAAYPHLAAMFTKAQTRDTSFAEDGSMRQALRLTEEQREAVLGAYNTALAILTDTQAVKDG